VTLTQELAQLLIDRAVVAYTFSDGMLDVLLACAEPSALRLGDVRHLTRLSGEVLQRHVPTLTSLSLSGACNLPGMTATAFITPQLVSLDVSQCSLIG
jgi:hypothetical protein